AAELIDLAVRDDLAPGAHVAGVTDLVAIGVCLVRVRHVPTVVDGVGHAIAVMIRTSRDPERYAGKKNDHGQRRRCRRYQTVTSRAATDSHAALISCLGPPFQALLKTI